MKKESLSDALLDCYFNSLDIVREKSEQQKVSKKSKSKRVVIFEKYNGHCAYCGTFLSSETKWNIDHIKPKSAGGTNDLENLNPSCILCNSWKGNLSIQQFQQRIGRLHKFLNLKQ